MRRSKELKIGGHIKPHSQNITKPLEDQEANPEKSAVRGSNRFPKKSDSRKPFLKIVEVGLALSSKRKGDTRWNYYFKKHFPR